VPSQSRRTSEVALSSQVESGSISSLATRARTPKLTVHKPSGPGGSAVTGIVLLLHGGQVTSDKPVRPWSLPLARMRLFIAPLQARGGSSGVAVAVLRYRRRGWNGPAADPLADTEWALDQLIERYGPVSVALIGHSMGGRAALRAGGHPAVAGVVALAPWVPEGEPVEQLEGRSVLIAHGALDRQIAPAQSLEYAARARAAGARVCRLRVDGSGHTLLSRLADWNLLAADFALSVLGAGPPPVPVSCALALARADQDGLTSVNGVDDPTGLDSPLPRDWRRRGH
jgi:predicted esterase